MTICHKCNVGQSSVYSDSESHPLQDEDHSASRPHSFPGLYAVCSGTSPEWPWFSGFKIKSSKRDSAPKMRPSVLLNSWDNFFVTLPSISLQCWVKYFSCDLRTIEFCAKLLLRCSSQFSLLRAASFRLFLEVAFFYAKSNVPKLILNCLFYQGNQLVF